MMQDDFPTTANGCRLEANACRTAAARLVRQADDLEEYADQLEATHGVDVTPMGRPNERISRWRQLSGFTRIPCGDCGDDAEWVHEWASASMAGLAFNYYCALHGGARKVRA